MADLRLCLDLVTTCFPDKGLLIRRLCLVDPSFRSLCEEYELARTCLTRFESLGDAAHKSEIEDYQTVIAALEMEIAGFFVKST